MSRRVPPYSTLIHRAVDFAARAHEGHFRKEREAPVPYFTHCVMVGRLLEGAGFSEAVVAAGILHDTVEDTETTLDDLKARFGEDVASLVAHVTEKDKSLPWKERKQRYLEGLKTAPIEALAVACADKTHNLWSLILRKRDGLEVWSLLKEDRETQIARFCRLGELFRSRLDHPLRTGFEEAFETLVNEC